MPGADPSTLERLLAAEGATAPDPEPAWRAFVEHVAESLDVGPGTSVWDVGCGAGAFLYPFWENGYVVGGVDASAEQVALATEAMPQGQFVVGTPSTFNPAEPWDVVIASRGYAHCLDLDQVRGMLARMVAKATHAVAVLNVVDTAVTGTPGTPGDRATLLRMLAEIGVTTVQFETAAANRFHAYAKV
jgi:SAM-dependent methyltransferase